VGALARVTTTSFFPAKPLGAYGDAGAIFTDDAERLALMRSIHVHGEGASRYDILRLGLNARLDTLQAAVLLAKLTVFDDELARRDALATFYDERLADVAVVPTRPEGVRCAWAQYTIQIEAEVRDGVRDALLAEGIPTAIYYPRPMHLQPAYAAHGDGEGSLPVSERLAGRVLSLPMHAYLSESDGERICATLRRTLGAA
jgi:dTDP-4-amino-4,6-dideoxygalactose transaminase